MLYPPYFGGKDLTLKEVSGPKAAKLSQAKNIRKRWVCVSKDKSWEVTLYIRMNVKNFEAGVLSLPGPNFACPGLFRYQMFRVFGSNIQECFEAVRDYYSKQVAKYHLQQVYRR